MPVKRSSEEDPVFIPNAHNIRYRNLRLSLVPDTHSAGLANLKGSCSLAALSLYRKKRPRTRAEYLNQVPICRAKPGNLKYSTQLNGLPTCQELTTTRQLDEAATRSQLSTAR